MNEIDKLRKRLKNVNRNVTTYNMSIEEALALVNEFEILEENLKNKATEIINAIEKWKSSNISVTPIIRPMDGGVF